MRKPIIAGNWKMHKTAEEASAFIQAVKDHLPDPERVDAVVCSSPLFLERLVKESEGTSIKIGAQNAHYEEEGAYTGEVSPHALTQMGVSYVIIGHSERR